MRSFVPTKEGMSLANPCFVSSVRLTMCDIMCTTNSAHPTHQSNKSRAGSDSILASIPYEKVKSLSGPHKATTKFQKYKGEGVDRLRKDELKRDRREFYTNLFREKEEVNARRKRAATKIQATFRGYRVRPIKNRYIPLKKKIHMYSQFEMQDDLCSLASVLNLPPIPGMSLEARSKASKRKLKIENAAAYILQRLFRMIRQRKMALIVVRTKHAELINRSSRIITRAIRFIITKKFVKRVDIIKREQSAKVVQKYVRRFMARRRVRLMLNQRHNYFRRNEAAIIIQRNLAERHRGTLRLARATIASLRSFRKMIDVTMDVILNTFIDDGMSAYLDQYLVEWEAMSEEIVCQVEEHCVNEVTEEMLVLGMVQHIQAELKRIAEENRRMAEERRRMQETMAMSAEEDLVRTLIEAHKKAQQMMAERERRRHLMYATQKEQFIEGTVLSYIDAGVDRQVEREMKAFEATLFARTVSKVVEFVTDNGKQSATSLIMTQFLLDLANQTSLVIADMASRMTDDTISIGLSLFSDRQSFLAREIGEVITEEASTIQEVDTTREIMGDDQNSLADEVRSEVMEVDDDSLVGGKGEVRLAIGKSVSQIVKDVRGAAQYITQAHYEAALQDLAPALELIEHKLEEAEETHKPEHVVVKISVVLSVLLLLKARALFALARYMEAKEILQEVYEIRKEAFDSKHYLIGEEMCARAEYMRSQAQYGAADRLMQQANIILSHEMKIYDDASPEIGYSSTVFKVHHRILLCRAELLRNSGQYYKAHDLLLRIESSLQKYKKLGLFSFEIEEDFIVSLMAMFVLSGKRLVAMQWHDNLLLQRKSRYGDRHPKIASSLCTLGKIALELGQLDRGALLIDEGVRMRYEFYPSSHPAISAGHLLKSIAFISLGKCHDGFLEAAAGLRGFQTMFANMKPLHPAVGNALLVLGIVQISLGEPALASKSFAQVLEIYRANFSIELHIKINEAVMWQCISMVQRKMFKQAIPDLKGVVEQRERILQLLRADRQQQSAEVIDLELAKAYLGHCYAMTAQIQPALALLPDAVKRLTEILGEEHQHVCLGLCFLGQLSRQRGNFSEAKVLFDKSQRNLLNTFPRGHPLMTMVAAEAADSLRFQGFVDEASDINEGGFNIAMEVFANSPSNSYTAQLLKLRADLLSDIGAFDDAEPIYMQGINLIQQKAGITSGSYALGLLELSEFYHRQERWQLAERTYLQSVRLLRPHFGSRSIVYQQAILQYSVLLMDGHQWKAAQELLQGEILPALQPILSPQHPLILYAEANLSVCLYMQNQGMNLSLANSQSLTVLSEAFMGLPKVHTFLSSWTKAGFPLAHRWVVRMQQLPELLSKSLSASVLDSNSLSYYSTVSDTKAPSDRRSMLSVISERESEESISMSLQSLTRSYLDGESIGSDTYTYSQDNMSEASQSVYSTSLGTAQYDYDHESQTSASYLSPRSLSYASYTNSLSPRSHGDSLDGSPRSYASENPSMQSQSQTQSQSQSASQTVSQSVSRSQSYSQSQSASLVYSQSASFTASQSLMYSQTPSQSHIQTHHASVTPSDSRQMRAEESTLESWEQSPNRSLTSGRGDTASASYYDDHDELSVLSESQLQESMGTAENSLGPDTFNGEEFH